MITAVNALQTDLAQQQQQQQLQQQQADTAAYNAYLAQAATAFASSDATAQQPDASAQETPQSSGRSDFYTSVDAPDTSSLLASAPTRAGAGSANQAADWMKGVMDNTGVHDMVL